MSVLRNLVAAVVAILLLAMLGRLGAPALAEHLPGKDAVSAVLGLGAVFLPIVYKLLDSAMASVGFGRAAPASSRWVSVLAGGAVLALIGGAFAFAMTYGLAQALLVAKGAPAAEAFLHAAQGELPWVKLGLLLFAALMIGSWAGRRHGFLPTVAIGFSLLGWIAMLGIEVLSRMRDMAAVQAAFRAVADAPSPATPSGLHLAAAGGDLRGGAGGGAPGWRQPGAQQRARLPTSHPRRRIGPRGASVSGLSTGPRWRPT